MNFYPSWKALFGQHAAAQPDLKDFRGYAELLQHGESTSTCVTHLKAAPESAALVFTGNNKVKMIHHFDVDVKSPVLPQGTGKIWALLGNGATASPIEVPMNTFGDASGATPTFADIQQAKTIAELRALKLPSSNELKKKANKRLKFDGKRAVATPPFLTKILMDADTEDPFVLLQTTCKALADLDSSIPVVVEHPKNDQDGSDDDDAEEPESSLATEIFFRIVQYLFLVARGILANGSFIDTLTTSCPQEWATATALKYGVAVNGTRDDSSGDTARSFANFGASLNRVADAVQANTELLSTKVEKDTKKSKVGQGKLVEFVTKMICNASEPIPVDATDANGDPITSRTKLIDSYQTLLECTTVGQMREHIQHFMNDDKGCSSVLPLSTCNAIFSGKLRWTSLEQPEPFSLMSCYHLAVTAVPLEDIADDAAAMHLRSAEGIGLNDEDIRKATKLALLAPTSIDVLAKQVGVFSVLCTVLFGQASDIVKELDGILAHITRYEAIYQNLQAADRFFATKFACLVDRKLQLHLGECLQAATQDEVSVTMLSFDEVQRKILEGTFESKVIPAVILRQLQGNDTGGTSDQRREKKRTNDGARFDQTEELGHKKPNRALNPKWRLTKNDNRMIGFFVTSLARSPLRWGKTRKICLKWHCVGECHDNCAFGHSHDKMREPLSSEFDTWFASTMTAWQQNENGTSTGSSPKKAKAADGSSH